MLEDHTLAELRHNYLTLGRPLSAEAERWLKADGRPGALAILTAINKRRFALRDSAFASCCVMKRCFGKPVSWSSQASTKPV
jgi:hypothetical protein